MTDTQGLRYQVFLQEKAGDPHQDAGSVHASDPEMALLNARDVFVRRPECVSLWVAPAEAIYSKTGGGEEEQRSGGAGWQGREAELTGVREKGNSGVGDSVGRGSSKFMQGQEAGELFYVFCKMRPAGTQTFVGEVQAVTPGEAMEKSVEKFSGRQAPLVWWVVPARQVLQSSEGDIRSMFHPARDKPYRHSTGFRTVTAMREIKTSDSGKATPHPEARIELSRAADGE